LLENVSYLIEKIRYGGLHTHENGDATIVQTGRRMEEKSQIKSEHVTLILTQEGFTDIMYNLNSDGHIFKTYPMAGFIKVYVKGKSHN